MKGTLVIILSLLKISLQKSTPESDYYKAGVVEFHLDDIANVTKNLEQYVKIINKAGDQDIDILIFPEKTLTGFLRTVPVPLNTLLKKYPVPAFHPDKYDDILVTLSNAAKDNEIYVLVNIQELLDCRKPQKGEPCPEKRKYIYSANIVFDRTGAVIHRSRKMRLFGEPSRTGAPINELEPFDTDFGVKFADLIELDLLFQQPHYELPEKRDVVNFIVTAAWYNELPYFISVQTLKSISTGANINLLAAGANAWERDGAAGSGIFSGTAGTLISLMKRVPTYRMLVADVPKTPGELTKEYPGPLEVDPSKQDGLLAITDKSIDKFLSIPLVPGYQELSMEYQDICCNFTVNITFGCGKQHYRYRAVAFSGVRRLVVDGTAGVRTCSIIACTGDDIYSCGKRFPKYCRGSTAHFSELTVVGTVPKPQVDLVTKHKDSVFYCNTLTTSLSSLQPEDLYYNTEIQGMDSINTISLKNLEAELYTFGYHGRKFTDDGKPESKPFILNTISKLYMEQNQ